MQNPPSEPTAPWRPADEAEACGTLAAFIEWRRALAGAPLTGSAAVWAWEAAEPERFGRALLDFAGLAPRHGYRAALAAALEAGARLFVIGARGRSEIGAAALGAGRVPPALAVMLAAGDRAALAREAADHLLRLELRPDQRVLWPGPLGRSWPLGALLTGATLLVCATPPADPAALAAAEGARLLRPPA